MKAFWGKATSVVGVTVAAMPLFAQGAFAQGRDAELDTGDSDQGVQYYEEKGFYFGAGLGIAKSNQDVEDFNDSFLTILTLNGFEIDSGSAKLKDSDTAFSLTAGYNFNQYLGAEVSYINFGTVEYRARARVQQGLNTLMNASSSADIKTQGVALAGVGRLPVSDAFAVRTKLGLIFAKSDVDLSTNLPSTNVPARTSLRVSDSTNEANLFVSVGATYSLENRWTFSLDYEILKRTGDARFLDDIGTVTLGLAFRL
jgi:hypothetical protein